MSKPKTLLKMIKDNGVELWLSVLLFVVLPYAVATYTDWRGFLVTTIVTQTIVFGLFIYKGRK